MKFKLLFFLFFGVGILLSQENNNTFEIHGEIKGEKRGKVKLILSGTPQYLLTKLNDGKFVFKGTIAGPMRATINHKNIKSLPFYIESSKINVSFAKTNVSVFKDTVGLRLTSKFSKTFIYTINSSTGSKSDDLYRAYIQFKKDNIEDENYRHLLFTYLNKKLDDYPNHLVYVTIISQLCYTQQHLSYPQLVHLINRIDLIQQFWYIRHQFKYHLLKFQRVAPGKFFPEKYVTDLNGNQHLISSSYGKYTLVHIWTSWCLTCKEKFSELKSLYTKYNPKGFNVIGVSKDKEIDVWKQAVKTNNFPWVNYYAPSLAYYLLMHSVPLTYLIDENARIVGVNLSLKEIEAILNKNL